MTASSPSPNRLLQMLDAANFDLLRPHVTRIELVRTTVLGEAGAAMRHVYFPHDGTVSLTVGLSEAQTIEVAMLGRDGIIGGGAAIAGRGATGALAAACPGYVRQRNPAADAGDSGSDDGSAAQRHFADRTRAATCRHHPLQPGPDRNHRSARAGSDRLRLLCRGEGAPRACWRPGDDARSMQAAACWCARKEVSGDCRHLHVNNVPIANISRREHDGTYPCKGR